MKLQNYMKLEFPSNNSNESLACSAVASFAAQVDPTLEELGDIRTAVSEAVTNCIRYAYPDKIGVITVRCRILKDNVLDIVIKDNGVGIEELDVARRPMHTSGGPECSGMGFTIMEAFMTEFEVLSKPGGGTTVHMKKRIKSKS